MTDAVKVTLAPAADGLVELESELAVETRLTISVSALLVEPLFTESPLYKAVTLWLPAASTLVLQVAVRMFPEPFTIEDEQPPIEAEPSLKLTVPVGKVPLTVAVKVTLVPTVEGVNEVAMPVVLPAPFTVCDNAVLPEGRFAPSPP